MAETKEQWPDSKMSEPAKQLREIIGYKKKDIRYSNLTDFEWTTYTNWPSLRKIKEYRSGTLFLVKDITGYWWMNEISSTKYIRPPTADGSPNDSLKKKGGKIGNYAVASFNGHVVLLNKSKPIGRSHSELNLEALVKKRKQNKNLDIHMVGWDNSGAEEQTTKSHAVPPEGIEMSTVGVPVGVGVPAPAGVQQTIQRGYIYVAKKKTLGGYKIVIVWCWGIRSRIGGWTNYISIFLPQLESDEQLPKNLTPGGRKWDDCAAAGTITLLPENAPTAFYVGDLVLGPRNGADYYVNNGGTKPHRNHHNNITWKDPENTAHGDNVRTVELLKLFNENRFEVMELDNKSTRDILLLTKLRLERLISIGIAFRQGQIGVGSGAVMASGLRSATRGFMSAEPNYEPVLYKPFNVYANENVNDAVRFTELLECVDDVCKVISHRTGALVSEMESTHLEENKIDKILWCCCNSCKKGHNIPCCKITSRKPFLHTWYIIMAAGIAAAGLGTNSAPVVVASMLVSSMMEPIKGLATAARCQGTDNSKCSRNSWRFFAHFVLLMCDVGLCLVVGYIAGLIFSISSEDWNNYTLTEQLSGTAGISSRTRSISLPQEIYGRGEVSGLVVAVVVALFSTFALITADKSDNKSALVGIGISASLLPPIVNAGLLFGMHDRGYVAYIGASKSEPNLQTRGGISLALAFINIGIIVVIWTMGFLCQRYSNKKKWCRHMEEVVEGRVGAGGGRVGAGGGRVDLEANERSSLLRF
tara:strand:- start:84 stop:2354 length:2271 start_codon:yes stop_codon:yes gene_type:complete